MLRTISTSLVALALFGCEPLPPAAALTGPSVSLVAVEHWTLNLAKATDSASNFQSHSQAAIITWRLGRDAELPRAWMADDACMVTEGSWRDSEFSQPDFGRVDVALSSKTITMDEGRTWVGASMAPDTLKQGVSVTVSAAGAAMPAFTFAGEVGPQLTLSSHPLSTAKIGELTVVRSAPLRLTWAPVDTEVVFSMAQYGGTTDELIRGVFCHWAGQAGEATVPGAALDRLLESGAVTFSDMYFGSAVHQLKEAGEADLKLWMWNGYGSRILVK